MKLSEERAVQAEGGPKAEAMRQAVLLMCSRKRRETSLGGQEIIGTIRKAKVPRFSRAPMPLAFTPNETEGLDRD